MYSLTITHVLIGKKLSYLLKTAMNLPRKAITFVILIILGKKHSIGCPMNSNSRLSSQEDTYEGDAISLRSMELYNNGTGLDPIPAKSIYLPSENVTNTESNRGTEIKECICHPHHESLLCKLIISKICF